MRISMLEWDITSIELADILEVSCLELNKDIVKLFSQFESKAHMVKREELVTFHLTLKQANTILNFYTLKRLKSQRENLSKLITSRPVSGNRKEKLKYLDNSKKEVLDILGSFN